MSCEIIQFSAAITKQRAAKPGMAQELAIPLPTGAPMPDDYFTQLFSMSFFKLPFVTLPQEAVSDWGEFWQHVEMWNDEPTGNPCTDYHRGKKYAQRAVEILATERATCRQLEIVVERMVEKAFRRRGTKGTLCRKLSSAEEGFITELCKLAVGAARP